MSLSLLAPMVESELLMLLCSGSQVIFSALLVSCAFAALMNVFAAPDVDDVSTPPPLNTVKTRTRMTTTTAATPPPINHGTLLLRGG